MRDGSRWRLDEVPFEGGEESQHSKEKRVGIRRRDHRLREMGNLIAKEEPPPMVLVPPIFDFPPIAARTRMLVPSYDLMFGKLALHCLFEDYFEKANRLNAWIMLKPLEDPNVDLIATVSSEVTDSLDKTSGGIIEGEAMFRWQRDLDNPNTFIDLLVSTNDPTLRLRLSSYSSKYQIGAFGVFPLLKHKRLLPEDYGLMGMRYGSERLSIGSIFMPFPLSSETPFNTWLIGRAGRLSAGVLFKSVCENKRAVCFKDLNNWSCAIGYDIGLRSPLCPSYNFSLELARNSQLIASFYQHLVVQRRVKNPFEESEIVGITNYIDFGFELRTRINEVKSSSIGDSSLFQLAASWQANKNFLLKGKLGPLTSSVALAFKSWWRPSFTFSITANNDPSRGTTYGFGIRVEDLREPSYQRADPNYVMLTPNKEHLATGVLQNFGKMPLFQSNIDSGNYDHLPRELKPIGKIF
ncbi:hypothetical protein ZIOFF_029205 [Zingiber officinale]|uniref:Uncharacterized protein n=1 Tax=Zingiber officinale TaxID=94328 RepID=A0A8J5L413_ZINOF|nr:hypothetical protein ZIOFF_029205 [Zingiber officinale]